MIYEDWYVGVCVCVVLYVFLGFCVVGVVEVEWVLEVFVDV